MREQKLGPGINIVGFDSMEEMLAYQAEQEAIANAQVLPKQLEITWGDYVFRVIDGLAIWGEIFTRETFLGPNEDDEELIAEWEDLQDAYDRGYRYGQWYSVVEPKGEYGSAHLVNLWKITERDFERARLVNWEVWSEFASRISEEILQAHNQQGKD